MEYAAQILLLSPDATLLQAAERSLSSLGHRVLLAMSLSQAQRTLTRVRADVICLDSVLPGDELDQFSRWLRRDGGQPSPSVIFLAPPSARMVPSTRPAFYRRGHPRAVQSALAPPGLAREWPRPPSALGPGDAHPSRAPGGSGHHPPSPGLDDLCTLGRYRCPT